MHNMVIVTQDLDFSMLLAIKGYEKPSLIDIWLEEAKPDHVTSRIVDTVSGLEEELVKGVVITVDETSARYRYLPIIASASPPRRRGLTGNCCLWKVHVERTAFMFFNIVKHFYGGKN